MRIFVVFLLFLITLGLTIFGTSLFVLDNPPLTLKEGDDADLVVVIVFIGWIASFVLGGAVLKLAGLDD